MPIRPGVVLRLYAAVLTRGAPRPLHDHDALRWLGAEELASVAWLEPDAPLLPVVAGLLRG
jgi:8-oxo-dGTP diphosphatase